MVDGQEAVLRQVHADGGHRHALQEGHAQRVVPPRRVAGLGHAVPGQEGALRLMWCSTQCTALAVFVSWHGYCVMFCQYVMMKVNIGGIASFIGLLLANNKTLNHSIHRPEHCHWSSTRRKMRFSLLRI